MLNKQQKFFPKVDMIKTRKFLYIVIGFFVAAILLWLSFRDTSYQIPQGCSETTEKDLELVDLDLDRVEIRRENGHVFICEK